MDNLPVAEDYTRLVRHRSKLAEMRGLNFSDLPGGGLDFIAMGIAAGVVFVAAIFVVPVWLIAIPLPNALAAIPLIAIAGIAYFIAQLDIDGRDNPLVRASQWSIKVVSPSALSAGERDKSATSFEWHVVVMREPGAPGPSRTMRKFTEYAHVDGQVSNPIQGWQWPAAEESIEGWRYRQWVERYGGEVLVDDDDNEELDNTRDELVEA